MEIEGPVLWHILNFYRLYDRSDPRDGDPPLHYDLSFGTLSYKEVRKRRFDVIFEPGELETTKEPFRYNPPDCRPIFGEADGHLRFDRQNVVTLYLENALPFGISDPFLSLPSPHPESEDHTDHTPLDQRIRRLVRVFKVLRVPRNPLTAEPYLVTPKWLEQASRIYRKATSEGSASPTLPEFLVEAFEEKGNLDVIKSLNMRYGARTGETRQPDTWRIQAEELLKSRCILPNQTLH